jgi:hypothetical protein
MFEDHGLARDAETAPFKLAVHFAVDALGTSLVRLLVGARFEREVLAWQVGTETPTAEQEQRVRLLLYIVWRLKNAGLSPYPWLFGIHPELGGKTPIEVLRSNRRSRRDEVELSVLDALRSTINRE